MKVLKDGLRQLTPPLFWQMAQRLRSHFRQTPAPEFKGPFSSWAEAASHSDGWNSPHLTEKAFDSAIKVRDGLAEIEQDGVIRDNISYSATILAFLLISLSNNRNLLNIIDFGGGFGANFFQNRKIIHQLDGVAIKWNVVERPDIVKLGIEHFQTMELQFYPSLDYALASVVPIPDALVFTGAFQYIEEPFAGLDAAISAGIKILAFDRMFLSPGGTHKVFVQHPPAVHPANFPAWCFAKDCLVAWFEEKGFMLVEHFTYDPNQIFGHGMIFVKQPP